LKDELDKILAEAAAAIASAQTAEDIEALRVKYLGRKAGVFRDIMAKLTSLPREQRPAMGQAANALKQQISTLIDERSAALAKGPAVAKEFFDVTLPGRKRAYGTVHPLTLVTRDIKRIFHQLGFEWVDGPEIEDEWHNFDALNIPANHPARSETDNFYISDDTIIRSQTSSVQIRVMEKRKPPIRIIAPGRVYRPDTVDATHMFMFHQVELLMVDKGLTFVDLKNVITFFMHGLFGPDVKVRMRPGYFPFTEPSAETDFSCAFCKGAGCRMCKNSGWIEMGGSGMVDPNVFKAVGIDPEIYTGFAFGFGIDRLVLMKYGIDDIRLLTENDLRFLKQF
jgi:phenylalanyl-tRNA synthetase alpha chain